MSPSCEKNAAAQHVLWKHHSETTFFNVLYPLLHPFLGTLLIPQLIVMFRLIPYLMVLSLNIALTYTWYIYFTTITTKKYQLRNHSAA